MLKAFLVDDEPLARDELAYLLKRSRKVEIVGEADQIESALQQLSYIEADVIFLDIQLAEESGLELANKLLESEKRPEIVFATAYDEYALKAFDLHAVDYLLKPFDEERVMRTIEKLTKLFESKAELSSSAMNGHAQTVESVDKLAITVEDRIIIVPVKEILYIYSEEGKTVIITMENKYEASDSLITFERKLINTSIVRVHRAYLVNLNQIKEIQPWFHSTYNLMMPDGETVPVSRTYTKELKKRFGF